MAVLPFLYRPDNRVLRDGLFDAWYDRTRHFLAPILAAMPGAVSGLKSLLNGAASHPDQLARERSAQLLRLVELEHLAAHLDEHKPWDQYLTPVQQQWLGLARTLLHESLQHAELL